MNEKEIKHFYNSKEWKQKRNSILLRDHYECQDCVKRLQQAAAMGKTLKGEEKKIRRAVDVHHIKELREYPELKLESENLVSLCKECHNIRHGRNPKRFVPKKKKITEERW